MANAKHFRRGGRGVFNCETCGGLTRQGHQENPNLCFECYEIAGYENSIQDDHMTVDEVKKAISDLRTTMQKRAGYDEQKFLKNFSIIYG